MKATIHATLEDAYNNSKAAEYKAEDWMTKEWEEIKVFDKDEAKGSGLPIDRVRDVGISISTLPADK